MLHHKNVSNSVVGVSLDVVAPCFGIIRAVVYTVRTVVPVIQNAKIDLTGVLTSRGFNQPVERIVDIALPGFDDGAVEKFGWNGSVEYPGNVAARVIGITEVLQDRFIGPGRDQCQ